MNFQSSANFLQIGPYRHYSYESQTMQLGPSLSSNLCATSLMQIRARETIGEAGLRPEEGRRRRRRAARAPAASCALAELLGWVRGGPSWPGHVSRRSVDGCSGGDGASTAKKGRGGARKAKERAVDSNKCVAGHREAEGPQQRRQQRAPRRHPWRPRSGVRARGGRAPG